MNEEQTSFPIDDSSPAVDIYRQFRGLIASGQLGAGERLPTVRQMALDLNVAPGTAAKAYKLLEREGLVTTRTAAGTRVAASAAVIPASLTRRIRDLVVEAQAAGSSRDDVTDVLRAVWHAESGERDRPAGDDKPSPPARLAQEDRRSADRPSRD